jgi:general stress protein YciG
MSDISQAAAAMGRKGGQSTSEAKRQAVRENGKKGGRPKGSKNKTRISENKSETSLQPNRLGI